MIELTNLTKTYASDIKALRGLTLTIGTGMFGLVGPNGAGKTTLMRILAGLIEPSAGSVRILGYEANTRANRMAIKAHLGYLPQELGLYPNLNAFEFLDYLARLKGINQARVREQQVTDAIERVGLTDVAHRPLKTYSGGMKRRVGVAQAILGQPRLIIVDEPTVGLDPEERVRLRNLLSELAQDSTVILSTHIIEDISQSCNALAVIARGELLFHGTPHDLITQVTGQVWFVETRDAPPIDQATIVSSVSLAETTRYRMVGSLTGADHIQPATPTLEDGYIWLMRHHKIGLAGV